MNETTMFLAQLWGPVLTILGIGILLSRPYYVSVYRNLERENLALMVTSITLMVLGIAHVLIHNAWSSLPVSIISALGWAMLVKGVVLAVFPRVVDRFGDRIVENGNSFTFAAVAALVLGGYLTFIGYVL